MVCLRKGGATSPSSFTTMAISTLSKSEALMLLIVIFDAQAVLSH